MLAKQGLGVKNKFRENAEHYYSANITVTDFNNPRFVSKEVNKWINGITNGNIPNIITPGIMNMLKFHTFLTLNFLFTVVLIKSFLTIIT